MAGTSGGGAMERIGRVKAHCNSLGFAFWIFAALIVGFSLNIPLNKYAVPADIGVRPESLLRLTREQCTLRFEQGLPMSDADTAACDLVQR